RSVAVRRVRQYRQKTLSCSPSIRLRAEHSEARAHPFGQLNWRFHQMAAISRLWLRPLDAIEARPLTGTEEATDPFWSPDSKNVAFFARGALHRVDLNGDAPIWLAPGTTDPRGGSWSSSGVILFNPENVTGLMRVPASGGTAVTLDPDAANG